MATNNQHLHHKKCYSTEVLRFDSGLFDTCVDMTYVLTMEGSDRKNGFMTQLKTHKPASTVTIQYNKGFRKCDKKNIKSSEYDITDALRNIFVGAVEKNYQRILVFEDDFFMDKTKYTSEDIDSICKFVKDKNPDVYNLGTLIHFSLPSFNNHHLAAAMGHAHSVIYNAKYMRTFIKDVNKGKIKHCDEYWNRVKFSKYSYTYPIVFQLFPETENMKTWPVWRIANSWLKYWKLDKTNEHYGQHFQLSLNMPWILIICTIVLITVLVLCLCMGKKTKIV